MSLRGIAALLFTQKSLQSLARKPLLHHVVKNRHNIQLHRRDDAWGAAGAALEQRTCVSSLSSSCAGGDEGVSSNPPIARREESRVVYAGVAPVGWNEGVPRQAESSTEKLLDPPVAIPDPYGWLRDESRTNIEVVEHLKTENAYTESQTKHLEGLRGRLYDELLSAIQETDYTTPRPHGNFYYYSRTFEGKAYTVYCRAPKASNEPLKVNWDGLAGSPVLVDEEVILDVNKLAEGHDYCTLGGLAKSPSHTLLAYSTDLTGDEKYQIFVKNLVTGKIVDQEEELEIEGSVEWGVDDETLFYLKLDSTHRPYQVFRRRLKSDSPDELVFEEPDDLFWVGISKSLDGKYLFVGTSSLESSEIHFLDLLNPRATLQCVAKRRSKVLYDAEHRNGQWWIESNVGGLPNMALWVARATANCQDSWKMVVDGNGEPLFDGGYNRPLNGVECFDKHVVAEGREGGLPRVWIIGLDESDTVTNLFELQFEEDAYDVGLGVHYEFETDKVVVAYDSLVTPVQSLEISVDDSSNRTILKERAVPGYDKSLYACERTTVTSRDGTTEIPVSFVFRKDAMRRHLATGMPINTHLYGYGSYGSSTEDSFLSSRLTLMNRGVVYVLAHVRGGGEMGRQWYEEPNGAKYLCKKNTFNDFVDVARWLIHDRKLTSPDLLSCEGASAGGLLIGASINQAPDMFRAAILDVPFVDVVSTMVDASLPLVAEEWEEWGNPNEEKYHEYMMGYSPMQNVRENVRYPSCLVTGGLHDQRVQFWEPAKFVAQLRHSTAQAATGSGRPVYLLKIDMSAGHFSASDRYKYLKELSFQYAFLLDQVGLSNDASSLVQS